MKIAQFKKKIYRTGKGYLGFTLPKSIGDIMKTRNVEITILSNGVLIIKPLKFEIDADVFGIHCRNDKNAEMR